MILTFHMPPQARGRDYVISIEYGPYCMVWSCSEKFQNNSLVQ